MADTYPTNDEYAKEVLKSDGGQGAFSPVDFLKDKARESTFQNKAGPGDILAASKSKKKKTKSKKGPR
tara:strand:+ start:447 stop:650 length:204 start_codon:yes stop_codon:yes gene_type:complete